MDTVKMATTLIMLNICIALFSGIATNEDLIGIFTDTNSTAGTMSNTFSGVKGGSTEESVGNIATTKDPLAAAGGLIESLLRGFVMMAVFVVILFGAALVQGLAFSAQGITGVVGSSGVTMNLLTGIGYLLLGLTLTMFNITTVIRLYDKIFAKKPEPN